MQSAIPQRRARERNITYCRRLSKLGDEQLALPVPINEIVSSEEGIIIAPRSLAGGRIVDVFFAIGQLEIIRMNARGLVYAKD